MIAVPAWLESFVDSRRLDRGAAAKTVEAYRADLLQLEASLNAPATLARPESVGADDLSAFVRALHHQGQKNSSIARKVSALRQYFKFCCLEKGLRVNPAERLRAPTPAARLPKALTHVQVEALLAAADRGGLYGEAPALDARDRAILYLFYASGLRVSELVELETNALDLQQEYVRVRGKGDQERVAPFAKLAGDRIQDYLEAYRPRLEPKSNHLFLGRRGEPLTRQAVWTLVKRLAAAAGIPTTVSPHSLRHSFATHLLQSGISLRSLQTLLGHADLSTTQVYTHVTPGHLKAAHKRHHPRGGD